MDNNSIKSPEENYKKWREIHGKAFGNLFLSAFEDNPEGQKGLTEVLILVSRREFQKAEPILQALYETCVSAFDKEAMCYFIGLNYEFMANLPKMNEYYGKLNKSVKHSFPSLFYPYYRTAKLAQKESECRKALHYFEKALELFSNTTPKGNDAETVSMIIYEMATVYLYCHEYEQCEKYLEYSAKFSSKLNQHREYVKATLLAIKGMKKESIELINSLQPILANNGKYTIDEILSKKHLHYCEVKQNRVSFVEFFKFAVAEKENIVSCIENNSKKEMEEKISEMLTKTFPFAKRKLSCKIETVENTVAVLCKNYCIKTLETEQKALFELIYAEMPQVRFISVSYYENEF